MIQYDLKVPDVSQWPGFSREFSASVASPSDAVSDAGSDIAILTGPSLWRATKNALKGEWIKILDDPPIVLKIID
ncbi:hypothetical protein AAF712_010240 [Marasmius tenuissimus]|uniref:Uncharacterized protein n=1 Tax=Marasmius tenuissimus TaxID=585030 RepID=A0ABR2ZPT1_9AGAR